MQIESTVILASASPYRRALLSRVLADYQCLAADIDETPEPNETPEALTHRLALEKARHIARQYPHSIVVGSDQSLSLDDRIMGKPGSTEANRQQLLHLSGRQITFYTAVAVVCRETGFEDRACVPTQVVFRELGDAEVQRYIDREPAIDCAGGFKIEGLGISLFERVRSDDPTALIGLPLVATCELLRRAGLRLP